MPKGDPMKTFDLLFVVSLASIPVYAQSAPNPLSAGEKGFYNYMKPNLIKAAEKMPEENYSFKPTPEMNTFAHLSMHIAQSNFLLCSKISGTAAPESKVAETDGKDKLVAAIKSSFDFCSTALANVDDSKLGESMTLFGNRPSTRAAAFIGLSDGWSDHYGAQAIYLRLSGILPPTAQPAKQ